MLKKCSSASVALMALLFCLSLGCAPKPKDALQAAEKAIAEAEAAGAAEKAPDPLNQAKQHLSDGKSEELSYRYNLARCEYEAATENANLAKSLAEQSPMSPECEECSAPESDGSCCLELDMANDQVASLKRQLSMCDSGARVITRVVKQKCPESEPAECPEPEAGGEGGLLMGTLMLEGPPGIVEGQADYNIKATYIGNKLTGAAADSDYRILIDVAGVEPEGVEAFSPFSQYEPLKPGKNEWSLNVNVPPDLAGSVKVTLDTTLWNAKTNQETKLPAQVVTIPNLSGCPQCDKCPPPPPAPKAESGWGMRIIMLLVGLLVGMVLGFIMFGRKKKSTI